MAARGVETLTTLIATFGFLNIFITPADALACNFTYTFSARLAMCGFTTRNIANVSAWDYSLQGAPTPSLNTGPSRADGGYMFMESSLPRKTGDVANLVSMELHSWHRCVSFDYNMYGISVGALRVYLRNSTGDFEIWSLHGNQGPKWHRVSLNIISSSRYQIVFQGVVGKDYRGDIAIDTFKADTETCKYEPRLCRLPDQFQCDSGECIYSVFVCDGNQDCYDGSDERSSVHSSSQCYTAYTTTTAKPSCSSSQYTCQNSKCIPYSYKCDDMDDCGDNSDEDDNAGCGKSTACSSFQYTCQNSKCISYSYKCDGMDDCGDNSDEDDNAGCACSGSQYTCQNSKCIPYSYKCDDMDDCGDNSDEDDNAGCVNFSSGAIVGAIVGIAVFLILIIVGSVAVKRSAMNRSQRSQPLHVRTVAGRRQPNHPGVFQPLTSPPYRNGLNVNVMDRGMHNPNFHYDPADPMNAPPPCYDIAVGSSVPACVPACVPDAANPAAPPRYADIAGEQNFDDSVQQPNQQPLLSGVREASSSFIQEDQNQPEVLTQFGGTYETLQ